MKEKKQDVIEQVPPNDPDAEMAVIGSIFNHDTGIEAMRIIAEILQPSDFYKVINSKIYQILLTFYKEGKPFDIILTESYIKESLKDDAQSIIDQLSLCYETDNYITPENAKHYATLVKQKAIRRHAIQEFYRLSNESLNESYEFESIIDKTGDLLADMKIAFGNGKSRRIEKASDFLAREKEAMPYIIGKGIIPAQGYTILAGYTGEGKSTLALQMVYCILKGIPFLGKFPIEKKDTHVLYVNLENSEYTMDRLIKSQNKEFNLNKDQLDHLILPQCIGLTLENQRDIATLERWIEEYHIELVVVDPILLALDSDQNDYTPVRNFIRRLQNIDKPLAWLFLHHFKKPGVEKSQNMIHSILGSSGWSNSATTVIALTRYAETRNPFYKKISFEKVRDFEKPEEIIVNMNPETRCYEVIADPNDIKACSPDDVAQVIDDLGGSLQYSRLLENLEFK